MMRVLVSLFAFTLRLYPRAFRSAYAREMEDVFAERLSAQSFSAKVTGTIVELADVVASALRARVATIATPHPVVAAAMAMGMLVTIVAAGSVASLIGTGRSPASGRIDFAAHDPAGEFSVTILNGRVVAGSMDNIPVPQRRLVHRGDSIRFLAPNGNVLLAIAYFSDTGRIEWQARSRFCPKPGSGCGG